MSNKFVQRYYEICRGSYDLADSRSRIYAVLIEGLEEVTAQDLSPILDFPFDLFGGQSPEPYEQVSTYFIRKVREEPDNPILMRNYCAFLRHKEPDRALELAEQRLLPLTPEDPDTLALITALRRSRLRGMTDDSEKAAELYRVYQSLKKEADIRGDSLLALNFLSMDLARSAYDVGHIDEAAGVAARCIEAYLRHVGAPPSSSVQSSVFHAAHLLLGQIALDRGDLAEAGKHLLRSVDLPAEEKYGIEFANEGFRLAKKLLALGERTLVLDYVRTLGERCSSCDREEVTAFSEEVANSAHQRPH